MIFLLSFKILQFHQKKSKDPWLDFLFFFSVKNTRKILNTTENTPIDILLFFAIENNDKKAFLQILNKGANLNTDKFENSIMKFAEINNPKFYKFIIKLNS